MPHKLLIIERDREIREASKTHNKKQLAAIYQMTDRQIRNICNSNEIDLPEENTNPTLDLFDKVI